MFHTCWSEGRKKRSFEIVCATTRKETVFNWLLSDELDSLVLNFTLDYMTILSFTHDKETLQPWRHQIKLLRLYFTFSYTYNNMMKKKVEKCSQKKYEKKISQLFSDYTVCAQQRQSERMRNRNRKVWMKMFKINLFAT